MKLYETTNVIEFHYGDVPVWAVGAFDAVVGIRSDTGASWHQVTPRPTGMPLFNYRFTPNQ